MKALLYCTKGKVNLYRPFEYDCFEQDETSRFYLASNPLLKEDTLLNGKIVCEVEIDKVEAIYNFYSFVDNSRFYFTKTLNCKELLEKAQLNLKDMQDYLFEDVGYALHLKNLKVFDRSKELSDYLMTSKKNKNWIGHKYTRLNKAPQNMCNVYDNQENYYVLISIQPQHLCKILNGEKTIEVRRKIISPLKNLMED